MFLSGPTTTWDDHIWHWFNKLEKLLRLTFSATIRHSNLFSLQNSDLRTRWLMWHLFPWLHWWGRERLGIINNNNNNSNNNNKNTTTTTTTTATTPIICPGFCYLSCFFAIINLVMIILMKNKFCCMPHTKLLYNHFIFCRSVLPFMIYIDLCMKLVGLCYLFHFYRDYRW